MSNARKSSKSAVGTDPVFNEEVPAINPHVDAIPEEGDDSVSGLKGVLRLVYGFRSCHRTYTPMVVRACRLLVTGGRPAFLLELFQISLNRATEEFRHGRSCLVGHSPQLLQ